MTLMTMLLFVICHYKNVDDHDDHCKGHHVSTTIATIISIIVLELLGEMMEKFYASLGTRQEEIDNCHMKDSLKVLLSS